MPAPGFHSFGKAQVYLFATDKDEVQIGVHAASRCSDPKDLANACMYSWIHQCASIFLACTNLPVHGSSPADFSH